MEAAFYHAAREGPLPRLARGRARLAGGGGGGLRLRRLLPRRVAPLYPAFLRDLPRPPEGEGARGDGLGHDGARGHVRARADLDGRHEDRVGPDERAVPDAGLVLLLAVVVAGDGARADVRAGAHEGVADVGEVVRLGALAEPRLLGLDAVADVRPLADVAPRAQARERPQARPGGDGGL